MSKINICIDGNYIAFAEFSLFSNYGKDSDPLGTERKRANFIQGLVNRIFYTINGIPKGGRLVFCLDSRSWRKEIDREYKKSREDSKGNKKIMDNATKEIFYKVLADLGDVLENAGICVSKVQGAEGDDLMFKWSQHFNNIGENCILVTGDGDSTQNVVGPQDAWTVVWNPKTSANKIYAIEGWTSYLSTKSGDTIFDFALSDDSGSLLKFIKDKGVSVEYVTPSSYVLKKILIGDDGDDVPAVWEVTNPNGKSVRVTDKKADRIIELLFEKFSLSRHSCLVRWDDAEFQDELAGIILRVMGDLDDAAKRVEVKKRLALNAKLVWLNDVQIPFNVQQMIVENITKGERLVPDTRKWNKRNILEGSKFDGSFVPSGLDPFGFSNLPDEL